MDPSKGFQKNMVKAWDFTKNNLCHRYFDNNLQKIFKQIFLIMARDRYTAQKMKFYIRDFSSKCDQIRRKLGIWSHLLKKSLMENFIF